MSTMIGVLIALKTRLWEQTTMKEQNVISNVICILEKVDDLADAYDILERDSGNEEGN